MNEDVNESNYKMDLYMYRRLPRCCRSSKALPQTSRTKAKNTTKHNVLLLRKWEYKNLRVLTRIGLIGLIVLIVILEPFTVNCDELSSFSFISVVFQFIFVFSIHSVTIIRNFEILFAISRQKSKTPDTNSPIYVRNK